MKKCFDPGLENARVDVILVHGLTGNRENTWTDKNSGVFWPEKLLPDDLPKARIFTYGYDADILHFWEMSSQSRIGNHAQTLLNTLSQVRERGETVSIPISCLFICMVTEILLRMTGQLYSSRTASAVLSLKTSCWHLRTVPSLTFSAYLSVQEALPSWAPRSVDQILLIGEVYAAI